MKRGFYLLVAAIALRGQVPTDAEIRAILTDRIDKLHQNSRDQKAKRVEQ